YALNNTNSFTSLHTAFLILPCLFFNDPSPTEIYTLSLHDALPIFAFVNDVFGAIVEETNTGAVRNHAFRYDERDRNAWFLTAPRSEEHTSELQSRVDLVCRLLLEKKKKKEMTYVLSK